MSCCIRTLRQDCATAGNSPTSIRSRLSIRIANEPPVEIKRFLLRIAEATEGARRRWNVAAATVVQRNWRRKVETADARAELAHSVLAKPELAPERGDDVFRAVARRLHAHSCDFVGGGRERELELAQSGTLGDFSDRQA